MDDNIKGNRLCSSQHQLRLFLCNLHFEGLRVFFVQFSGVQFSRLKVFRTKHIHQNNVLSISATWTRKNDKEACYCNNKSIQISFSATITTSTESNFLCSTHNN